MQLLRQKQAKAKKLEAIKTEGINHDRKHKQGGMMSMLKGKIGLKKRNSVQKTPGSAGDKKSNKGDSRSRERINTSESKGEKEVGKKKPSFFNRLKKASKPTDPKVGLKNGK